MNPEELFRDQSAEWGIRLTDSRLEALMAYARLLSEYEKARVIGTRDFRGILLEHVLDSLSCFLVSSLASSESLVDVGSGAGLPGIPIKLLGERIRVTLMESVEKKALFLDHAVRELDLEGVSPIRARAEEHGRDKHARGMYGAAVTRAVASLPVVSEYCVPLVAVGGVVVAMKGRIQVEELEAGRRATGLLGGTITDVVRVPFILGLPEKERHLVVIEKEKETPELYPRPVGRPAKRPLGMGG